MPKVCRIKQRTKRVTKRRDFCRKKQDVNQDGCSDFQDVNISVNSINKEDNNENMSSIPGSAAIQVDTETSMNSVSAKKIKPIEATTPTCHEPITGYRLMDMEILASIFCLLLCPSCCKRHLKLSEMNSKRKGLTSLLFLQCQNCSYFEEFCTSLSKRTIHMMLTKGLFIV